MATCIWRGGAAAVAQVDHLTPGGTIEAGDKFIVTMTGENGNTSSISYSATGTTVQSVVEGLHALLAASTDPLFAAVTWTEDGTKIIGTANTAGVPFYCSVSTTESDDDVADGQTFVRSTGTANSGPNDFNTPLNWLGGSVPGAAEDAAIFEYGSVDCLYGLYGHSLASIEIRQSYTGNIGLPDVPLDTGASHCVIGQHFGSGTPAGSGRINVKVSDGASVTVYATGSLSTDANRPPCRITGTTIASLTQYGGTVGVSISAADEPSVVATVNQVGGTLILGPGADVGDITKSGGTLYVHDCDSIVNSGGTTVYNGSETLVSLKVLGGEVTTYGTHATTAAEVMAGVLYSNSTGTITTLNLYGGTTDFTQSNVARTVTTVNIYPGTTPPMLKYDPAVITMVNKPAPQSRALLTVTAI
ncbi:MAG TPA: hypothetical protein PK184_19890 [Phycisphaerae bacterium]|nr:hypothetical protein [Phycisphaerae bacterium]